MHTIHQQVLNTDRYPTSGYFIGLLHVREKIRADIIRYRHIEFVTEYAEQIGLDTKFLESEYQAMMQQKVDFDKAFLDFFENENVTSDSTSYEQIRQFVKQYSIRYRGTITKSAMEKGMRSKGLHVHPSLYRKIDLEFWKSDNDIVLEAYIPKND